MSARVSTILNVKLQGCRYLIAVFGESNYNTDLQEAAAKQLESLATKIGVNAWVYRLTPGAAEKSFDALRHKNWNINMHGRLEKADGPFILILATDFRDFEPERDEWSIIWTSIFRRQPGKVARICELLETQIASRGNIFRFLAGKISGSDPSFPRGSLSCSGDIGIEAGPTEPGRPGILDPELRVRALAKEYMAKEKIDPSKRGIKTKVATWLQIQLAANSFNFEVKSIRDAVFRNGWPLSKT